LLRVVNLGQRDKKRGAFRRLLFQPSPPVLSLDDSLGDHEAEALARRLFRTKPME
jgi:hypothetical protein